PCPDRVARHCSAPPARSERCLFSRTSPGRAGEMAVKAIRKRLYGVHVRQPYLRDCRSFDLWQYEAGADGADLPDRLIQRMMDIGDLGLAVAWGCGGIEQQRAVHAQRSQCDELSWTVMQIRPNAAQVTLVDC